MKAPTKISCSVEVLTYNSAKTLEACLKSLSSFSEIIVLDGGSTDGTLEIAHKFGARIFPQRDDGQGGPIEDFSAVRNRGLSAASNEWFLYVDSDEFVSEELCQEIRNIISIGSSVTALAYKVPRKYVLEDQVIERASTYPNYQIRFWHIPSALGFKKKVHEQIRMKSEVSIGELIHPMFVPLSSLGELKLKWHKYIDLQLVGVSLTYYRLYRSIISNSVKFTKYLAKTIYILVAKRGQRLPLGYEWQNALYHIRLPIALAKKVLRHKFNA